MSANQDLKNLRVVDLRDIARLKGISIPANSNKDDIIKLVRKVSRKSSPRKTSKKSSRKSSPRKVSKKSQRKSSPRNTSDIGQRIAIIRNRESLDSLLGWSTLIARISLINSNNYNIDDILLKISKRCPNLQHLILSGGGQYSDDVLIEVTRKFPNLIKFETYNANITDKSIIELAKNCQKLEILSIDRCVKLTDRSLQAIGRLKNLSSLSANGCLGITDISLILGCKKLWSLELKVCRNLSDVSLGKLSFKNLKFMLINYCDELTDMSLNQITKNCPKLTRIAVVGCLKLSGSGLIQAVRNIPKLSHLEIGEIALDDDSLI